MLKFNKIIEDLLFRNKQIQEVETMIENQWLRKPITLKISTKINSNSEIYLQKVWRRLNTSKSRNTIISNRTRIMALIGMDLPRIKKLRWRTSSSVITTKPSNRKDSYWKRREKFLKRSIDLIQLIQWPTSKQCKKTSPRRWRCWSYWRRRLIPGWTLLSSKIVRLMNRV